MAFHASLSIIEKIAIAIGAAAYPIWPIRTRKSPTERRGRQDIDSADARAGSAKHPAMRSISHRLLAHTIIIGIACRVAAKSRLIHAFAGNNQLSNGLGTRATFAADFVGNYPAGEKHRWQAGRHALNNRLSHGSTWRKTLHHAKYAIGLPTAVHAPAEDVVTPTTSTSIGTW